uniref:Alcohol dehydrogenase-like N-terminal domain-containing protein n=1 Tax=Triticum urartu TaxID=4572 RepID=A0A8R7V5G5_TRIUA
MLVVVTASPGGPEALQVREVEDLPTPGEGEVLVVVGVAAAGVNRGDTVQWQGRYPPPAGASPYPGLECSGTIVALGAALGRRYQVCALPAYRRGVCREGGGSGRAAAPGDGGGVAD